MCNIVWSRQLVDSVTETRHRVLPHWYLTVPKTCMSDPKSWPIWWWSLWQCSNTWKCHMLRPSSTRVLDNLVVQSEPIVRPPPSAPSLPIVLHRMGKKDEPQSFLKVFQVMSEACQWTEHEWAVWLLPLLSREAQMAVLGLTLASLGNSTHARCLSPKKTVATGSVAYG